MSPFFSSRLWLGKDRAYAVFGQFAPSKGGEQRIIAARGEVFQIERW